jgi:protein-disulfide isomerase
MPRKFPTSLRAALVPILAALAGAVACASDPVTTAAPRGTPAAMTAPATPAATGAAATDPRILGAADAPVMIIEFTDLQCPYCARFAHETWPLLRERYVDTGKIRFATRDLPLRMHEFAVPAAVAARCAGQQGKFWEYREALFADQSRLGQAPYAELAGAFALDATRFEACRADPAVLQAVRADAALAAASGIASTPTFVIGRVVNGEFAGEAVSGALPFEEFQQRIDSLLQQPQQ